MTRRMLVVMGVALLCAQFWGIAGQVAGQGVGGELAELRSLFARSLSLEQSLKPGTTKISPDAGRFRQEFEETTQRIEFLKNAIIQGVAAGLEKSDLRSLDGYIAMVAGIPANDPVRMQFLPLSRALRSKVVFLTLSNRTLERQDLFGRLAFLGTQGELAPDVLTATAETSGAKTVRGAAPIHIAFHWHMHQPIYWPYEDVLTTERRGVYSYSVVDVFNSRGGPYNSWPYDAVKMTADAGLPNGGAQVSFSGSLIENLETLAGSGGTFSHWKQPWIAGRRLKTAKGNPRLDLVAFGFHHPLMALIGYEDIRRQIAAHREIIAKVFGKDVSYSKGIFPPENAFADWMIPALVDEGLEWAFVDNIHFNRACQGYPWVKGENLYPPNPADQSNPNPGRWIQLNGLWAPSKVSAWADRPHWVEVTDPKTGRVQTTPEGKPARMIAVPTERYLGNEDGRGGFGALNYEMVMSQLESENTDPAHPILLVLHHDGDNYGGGSDGYYHANFARFVEWVKSQPERFVCTTVQDYLDRFPPAEGDVIHVEPGSWAGADNGDPEFLKWNGDPDPKTGYSPDRNSWGVMTACRNIIQTAADQNVSESARKAAERMMMVAQTSCYEYWDGTEMWDSHPTRACNQALDAVLPLLSKKAPDRTPPALYQPQRQPYNPGGMEWGQQPESSDVTVWTYAYDFGDLARVELKYRVHQGKTAADAACRIFAGGTWNTLQMQGREISAQTNPKPALKAPEYAAVITGLKDALIDYYVVAADKAGNEARSPILHVYIGKGATGQGSGGLTWMPKQPRTDEIIVFTSDRPGKLHWGVNGWKVPSAAIWPKGTILWPDNKAVETPFEADASGTFRCAVGPVSAGAMAVSSIEAVVHFDDNTWGADTKVFISGSGN